MIDLLPPSRQRCDDDFTRAVDAFSVGNVGR